MGGCQRLPGRIGGGFHLLVSLGTTVAGAGALPAKDVARIDALADDLAARCAELQAAELPKRHAAKEATLKPAFATLCAATAELQALTAQTPFPVVETAVEKVHTQYQTVEELFQ